MFCFLWLVLSYVFLIDISGNKSTVSRFKQTQTSILEDNIGTFFFFFEVWRFPEKLKVTYLFWKASLRHVLQFSDYT